MGGHHITTSLAVLLLRASRAPEGADRVTDVNMPGMSINGIEQISGPVHHTTAPSRHIDVDGGGGRRMGEKERPGSTS